MLIGLRSEITGDHQFPFGSEGGNIRTQPYSLRGVAGPGSIDQAQQAG